MNALETKRRGIEYCNGHISCLGCPLDVVGMCIDNHGVFINKAPNKREFLEFSERFNRMIEEIYKKPEQTEDEKC